MIQFTNTLTGSKVEFKPLTENEVKMYHCGPTVYDDAHIGNLRSFVLADLLRRLFEYQEYEVTQVMNVTDIGQLTSDADIGEDKMVKGLKREGIEISIENMQKLGAKYTESFLEDLDALNIKRPTKIVPASSEIEEQINLIKTLEEKGYTYTTSDGVYFESSKFEDYGKLGNIDIEGLKEGARIDASSEKHSPTDFALWKFNNEFGFESPWGQGSPGWHIECSAISQKYLGETFDIHTGGIDLIPIHHNNEIAQSTCATGKPLANFWLHNAHVSSGDEKIAKSEGTGITLKTLGADGLTPLAYRYFLLTAHYSSPISFSTEAIKNAQNAYRKLISAFLELSDTDGELAGKYFDRFTAHLEDDLNTPQALAVIYELLDDDSLSNADKSATLFTFSELLGLGFETFLDIEIPVEVLELAHKRDEARINEDWVTSDNIRDEIKTLGFEARDIEGKTKLFPLL